jgi:hypothetical protein
MGYTQYTKCVTVENHGGKTLHTLAIIGAIVMLIWGGLVNPYSLVASLLAIIAYCRWWLYDRLICLGGERCAIGMLGNVEPPEKKTFPDSLDTDYSINLVLAPHNIQELPADYPGSVPPPPPGEDKVEYFRKKFKEALHRQIADDQIQGELIREQKTTGDKKTVFGTKSYPFEGYFSSIGSSSVLHHYQPYLHCEFEGGGVHRLYEAAMAALAFATAAAVVCAIPVFGWIACAILGVIALVITIAGLFNGLDDKGHPSVFDPKTGQTSTLENRRHILFVRGDWVYDTAHEGWNEIHPIKDCQLVAKNDFADRVDWEGLIAPFMVASNKWSFDMTVDPGGGAPPIELTSPITNKKSGPPTPADWKAWVQSWCEAVRQANSPLTVAAQQQPQNQWQTHPDVDGCRPTPSARPIG